MAETDNEKIVKISEKLYKKNKYFLNAAKILSQKEQLENNYEKADEYELWIMKNRKYTMRNYIEYVNFLEKAINYYYSIDDTEKLKMFIEKLNYVTKRIKEVENSSDELAYKIAHKPRLTIPDAVLEYIDEMNRFGENLG